MMARLPIGAALIAIAVGFALRQPAATPRERVSLDVSVVDDDGRSVSTLPGGAFSIREDGHPVQIESFRSVSAGAAGAHRGLAVVLDDANVGPIYTVNIQTIGRAFLARANPPDFVGVTLLSRRNEELLSDPRQSASRVDEFRAGSIVAFANETFALALRRLTNIARELALVNDGRNVIVCVGSPVLFNMPEPPPGSASVLRVPWVDLMHVLARTNTSIYFIDPTGLTGRRRLTGGGLADESGGTAFVNSNDFTRAVDRIWSEAGHYYVLEYVGAAPERVLHSIEVSVRGRGLHVHARRLRGDYHAPDGDSDR